MTTNTPGDAGLVELSYLADLCKRALEWSRTADKASAGFIVRDLTNSIEALIAEVERQRGALTFIRDGYSNQNLNHVDFCVGAYQVALDALRETAPELKVFATAIRNREG